MVGNEGLIKSTNSLPDPTGTWLISFADLLVLLLCSFILFFSQSHPIPVPITKDGIKVAPQPISPSVESLEFFSNDISKSGSFVSDESIKVVKKAVDLGFYDGEVVTLSLCNGANSLETASKFLTVFRESLVPEERLRVRFFGTPCSDLGYKDNPRGAMVAKIEIFKNG